MSAVNPLPSSEPATDKRTYEPSMEEILASIRRIIADDQSIPGRVPVPEPPQAATPEPVAPVSFDGHQSAEAAHAVAGPVDEVERPAPDLAPHVSTSHASPDLAPHVSHGVVAAPQFAMPHGPGAEPPLHREAAEPDPTSTAVPNAEAPHMAAVDDGGPVFTPLAHDSIYRDEAVAHLDAHHHDGAPAEPFPPAPEPEPPLEHAVTDQAPYTAAPQPQPGRDDTAPLFSAATDSAVTSAFNMLAASRLADNSDELMNLAREMIRPLLRTWIDDNLPSMVERMVRAEIERVARGGR